MATRNGGFLFRPRKPHGFFPSKQKKLPKKKKKKPEWDATTTDLSVYKPTKEELDYRHRSHQSKNLTKVKLSKENKGQSFTRSPVTPDTAERKKGAILQEILYGHDDGNLQNILAESDRTMSVVKDLFGDDPKKYKAFPNVTIAPQSQEPNIERRAYGLITDEPETPTHLSILSDSVMRTPALNELPEDEEQDSSFSGSSPEESSQAARQFESKLDLRRFQRYIAEEKDQPRATQISIPEAGSHPLNAWDEHLHNPCTNSNTQLQGIQQQSVSQQPHIGISSGKSNVAIPSLYTNTTTSFQTSSNLDSVTIGPSWTGKSFPLEQGVNHSEAVYTTGVNQAVSQQLHTSIGNQIQDTVIAGAPSTIGPGREKLRDSFLASLIKEDQPRATQISIPEAGSHPLNAWDEHLHNPWTNSNTQLQGIQQHLVSQQPHIGISSGKSNVAIPSLYTNTATSFQTSSNLDSVTIGPCC